MSSFPIVSAIYLFYCPKISKVKIRYEAPAVWTCNQRLEYDRSPSLPLHTGRYTASDNHSVGQSLSLFIWEDFEQLYFILHFQWSFHVLFPPRTLIMIEEIGKIAFIRFHLKFIGILRVLHKFK